MGTKLPCVTIPTHLADIFERVCHSQTPKISIEVESIADGMTNYVFHSFDERYRSLTSLWTFVFEAVLLFEKDSDSEVIIYTQ